MAKIFYFANNPLMSEHQNVIDHPDSVALPENITTFEEMEIWAKEQQFDGECSLFFPTASIKDLCATGG